MPAPLRTQVIIIGGGISGLATAYWLRERSCSVQLFEQSDQAGGCMRTESVDGYLFEHGPTSLMTKSADVYHLCSGVGLGERLVDANPYAKRRYLAKNRRLCALPQGPVEFLRTPLWSGRAKLRLLAEPFIAASRGEVDESVAQFISRRFGRELLDYGVDPFVSGVYAGDPDQLSIQSTFSRLAEWERESGSVIRGALFGRGRSAASGPAQKPLKRRLFSFREGLHSLPQAVGTSLGTALHLNSPVARIKPLGDGWVVEVMRGEKSERYEAQELVLATPADVAAQLLEPLVTQASRALREIPYAPIVLLFLGFRRRDVAHPLDGFGCLLPRREGFTLLGSLWSSTIFPGRTPDGMVALTNYLGGARRPELIDASDEELLALAIQDLRTLVGVQGEPQLVRIVRWKRAIPQYTIGHATRLAALHSALDKWPTLTLVGNYFRGISVPDCITQAKQAAHRLADRLSGRPA